MLYGLTVTVTASAYHIFCVELGLLIMEDCSNIAYITIAFLLSIMVELLAILSVLKKICKGIEVFIFKFGKIISLDILQLHV